MEYHYFCCMVIEEQRDASKKDEGAKAFYYAMQGDDWESVVDNDTMEI